MSLDAHRARVRAAERNVEAQWTQTVAHGRRTVTLWRTGWTPGRIVIAGLVGGFLTGRAQPLRMAGSGGLLALLRSLSGLLAASGLDRGESKQAEPDATPAAADDVRPAVWPEPPRREPPPFVTTP
ncbi:hypothetical protein [Thermomonas sp.]|uniref:hypothetical protein n=1 Tax=Thermomonas sp. TaxID=1971895 RepID=UPI00261F7E06|nr:hypothetical protein [Thermomonas sp.]